jgi:hypothetical protein
MKNHLCAGSASVVLPQVTVAATKQQPLTAQQIPNPKKKSKKTTPTRQKQIPQAMFYPSIKVPGLSYYFAQRQ